MSQQHHTDRTADCGLHSFERNRFFHGKLMTARDMAAEQAYHRNRIRTLTQHAVGEGIVCGLEATVEADGESLVVSIEPGLAFDSCGRPIVVETSATEDLDLDDVPNPVSLYVSYDDCVKETVPIPGSEDACGEECTYNRVLEIFGVEARSDPPEDLKPVPSIDFPGKGDFDDPADPDAADDALRRIAASYNEEGDGTLRPCDPGDGDGDGVFLGRFREGGDGSWSRVADAEARAHVYTNDMLYAAIARHAADFGNPHDVVASVDGVPQDESGDVGLETPDGTVDIGPRSSAHRIDLDVADRYRGTVKTVEGVEPDGNGNVDPVSTDGSITIEANPDADHEVDFRLAQSVQDTIEGLQADIEELREQHEEDLEELREQHETEMEELRERHEEDIEELREQIEGSGGGDGDGTEVSIDPSTVAVERADVAEFDVTFGGRDSLDLRIGNESAVGYELRGTLGAGSSDTATVSFDTGTAGAEPETLTVSGDATFQSGGETTLEEPLEAASYEIRLRSTSSDAPVLVVGTLEVEESEVYETVGLEPTTIEAGRGERATFEVAVDGGDRIALRIGDEEEFGYELRASLAAGSDDTAVLSFDTSLEGQGPTLTIEEGDAELAIDHETALNEPLDPATYPVALSVPVHGAWTVARASLSITR